MTLMLDEIVEPWAGWMQVRANRDPQPHSEAGCATTVEDKAQQCKRLADWKVPTSAKP